MFMEWYKNIFLGLQLDNSKFTIILPVKKLFKLYDVNVFTTTF